VSHGQDFPAKRDEDKSSEELIRELKSFRNINSQQKAIIGRYERIDKSKNAPLSDIQEELEVQREFGASLRGEIHGYREERATCNEELQVQVEELRVSNDELLKATESTKESEARLAADLKAMISLQRVSARFVEEGDLDSLLNDIMGAAVDIAGADKGTMQLIRPGSESLDIVAQHGFEPYYIDFFSAVSHGTAATCAKAFERGERVIVEDVIESPIFVGTPALDVQMKAAVRAVQSTPIVNRRGKMIGMFSTHWGMPHRPDERVLLYMDLLARQAADIIERKRNEDSIKTGAINLARAEKLACLGHWYWDLTSNNVSWSDGHFLIFAYPVRHGTETYEMFKARVHPDDIKSVEKMLRNGIEKDTAYDFDYRLLWPDGSIRYIHAEAERPIKDDSGRPVRWFGIVQDVTERKRAEEALRNSERLYRAIGESIDYGVWVCAPDGRNIYASESFLKLVGMTQQQISDFGWGDVLHPDDAERTIAAWKECVRTGGNWDIEHRFRGVDGKYHPILARGVPVRDENGEIIYWAGINLDISRIKQSEAALNDAKAQAELYVDLMGHDINNINHAIMGYLELALIALETEKKLKLEDKLLIERPLAAVQNSSKLIDNVRKLQRLMKEGVKTKPIDLGEILEEINGGLLNFNGRDVVVNIPTVKQSVVEANELLRDVFLNLITNAVKHSDEEKSLTINMTVEPVQFKGRRYYRCVVEDNGPGIPDELKAKLFQRFKRGASKAQGKGLGLYLVRTLVEGYHGKVWVEDRVQGDHKKGSRFVVVLPAI
jgi:PAS domain S-box-containing protein